MKCLDCQSRLCRIDGWTLSATFANVNRVSSSARPVSAGSASSARTIIIVIRGKDGRVPDTSVKSFNPSSESDQTLKLPAVMSPRLRDMTRFRLVWIVGFLLFSSGAQGSITPFLEQGDGAFRARENPDRAREALKIYRQAVVDSKRQDAQALWREAMGCYFVGLRLTDSKSERAEIFQEGREAGQASVRLDPGVLPATSGLQSIWRSTAKPSMFSKCSFRFRKSSPC